MQDWKDLDISVQTENTKIIKNYIRENNKNYIHFICEFHGTIFYCNCMELREEKLECLERILDENIEYLEEENNNGENNISFIKFLEDEVKLIEDQIEITNKYKLENYNPSTDFDDNMLYKRREEEIIEHVYRKQRNIKKIKELKKENEEINQLFKTKFVKKIVKKTEREIKKNEEEFKKKSLLFNEDLNKFSDYRELTKHIDKIKEKNV